MSGPTTPARDWPDETPKTPIATAIASSKLLPAAVNATAALLSYGNLKRMPSAKVPNHMITK